MKKIGFFFSVILVIVLCLHVAKIATNLYGDEEENTYVFYREEKIEDKYIQYTINKGEFIVSDVINGNIVYDEDAIVTIQQDNQYSDVKINVEVGDNVKKNDVLCYTNDKKIVSPVKGRVLSIEYRENIKISIVDYSKTQIVVNIPESKQNYINSNTVIYGTFNNSKKKELKIIGIQPVVEDECFKICLENKFNVYENTKIGIDIEYKKKKEVVSIPKEYIRKDTDGNRYIMVLNNTNEIKSTRIMIGEENGTSYEILKGDGLVGKIAVIDKKESMVGNSEQ